MESPLWLVGIWSTRAEGVGPTASYFNKRGGNAVLSERHCWVPLDEVISMIVFGGRGDHAHIALMIAM